MTKPITASHRPAQAQDIQTILDVILQFINVIEAIYRVITSIFGSSS